MNKKVFLVLLGILFVGMFQRVKADEYINITTTQVIAGNKIETTLSEGVSGSYNWYIGGKLNEHHDSYYKPSSEEYESWIKVEIVDENGHVIGSDSIYYSKLPVVYITTDDGQAVTSKEEYKSGTMLIQGNSQYEVQYDGKIDIKGRGNSTWNYPKKPYKVKLAASTNLFGFGKNKHWVLLANYLDESLVRNTTAVSISEQLGLVTTQTTWVDVVFNGQYVGNYQLCEQIKIAEARINIFNWDDEAEAIAKAIYKAHSDTLTKDDRNLIEETMTTDYNWISNGIVTYKGVNYTISDYYSLSTDITKGYLFELSEEYDEVSKLTTSSGYKVMLKAPENLYTNETMMDYVTDLWQGFDNAIHSIDGYNALGKSYLQIADLDSMVGYWLTNEIMGNNDASKKSRYAYTNDQGVLVFGPVWDFDYGCGSSSVPYEMEGWKLSRHETNQNFYKELLDDPYFTIKAEEKYWQIRDYLTTLVGNGGILESYYNQLKEAGQSNESMWYFRRGFTTDFNMFKAYLTTRINWLDSQFASEKSIMESLKTDSAYPYEVDENLTIAYLNAYQDTISKHAPSGGLIEANNDLSIRIDSYNTSISKVVVYVNGIKNSEYALSDNSVTLSIPASSLTEEINTKNVISVIAYNEKGQVVGRNYRSIIVTNQSFTKKEISKLTVEDKEVSICIGENYTIQTQMPSHTLDATLKYTSSNTKVASVNANGIVKGIKEGKTTITISTVNGKSVKVTVTVKNFPFVDVNTNNWYYNYVSRVYNLELMTGTDATHFKPTSTMTRGMVATVLYRIAGQQEIEFESYFPDVVDGKYYSKAVTWCYETGIVVGNSDGTFRPANEISRQELAIMLRNFAKYMKVDISKTKSLGSFADANEVSSWAKEAVEWAYANGIITGKKINDAYYIDPKKSATRAECAKMLLVAYELL